MLPFGIGFSEIIVVLLILIIFVGPEGIPQAIRTITKIIRTIRSMIDEIKYSEEFDEVKREILQPLEEARRFNPRQKAEAWVKNEIENPIRDFTKEHVEDFQEAMDSKTSDVENQESNIPPVSEALNHHVNIQNEVDGLHTLEANNHTQAVSNEDEDEDEDDYSSPVASINPLERGIKIAEPLTNQTLTEGSSHD